MLSRNCSDLLSTGLLQPIVVRRCGDAYEVVFGNHRLEAFRRLGKKRVPAVIKRFTDEEAFLARVSENLIRNVYVDSLEEAECYRMLVARGWTINAIGRRVGKCDSYVSERLALLERLSPNVRQEVSRGLLKPSHAELLSRIKDLAKQNEVAELVTKKKLSVRSLEDMLTGVPVPTKVQVEMISGECYVRIPTEFIVATGFHQGKDLFMYIRGKKLVLDSAETSGKRRTRMCGPSELLHKHRQKFSELRTCEGPQRRGQGEAEVGQSAIVCHHGDANYSA